MLLQLVLVLVLVLLGLLLLLPLPLGCPKEAARYPQSVSQHLHECWPPGNDPQSTLQWRG